jgi:hypothetical protein
MKRPTKLTTKETGDAGEERALAHLLARGWHGSNAIIGLRAGRMRAAARST